MRALSLFLTLIVLALPALAKDEIVPVPPDFVLDKQLPGSDPYWMYRPTFSNDGKYLVCFVSSTKVLNIYEVASGKLVKEVAAEVHNLDAVDGMEFTLDGKQLVVMRNFQPMKWIDWNACKVTRELATNADPKKIMDYTFSPDQGLVALATNTGVALWDLKAGKKLKTFVEGTPIDSVDWLEYTPPKQKKIRLLAYGKAIMPPNTTWKDVAGIIDIDTGKVTPILNDIPADKKIEGKMTFTMVRWEWGGQYLLVTYWTIPPDKSVKAGVVLVDSFTGKYLANHDLEQLAIGWAPRYLGKPFYGFEVATFDMSANPYATAAQFLVPTRKEGLKILDTINETVIPIQSISVNRTGTLAAITTKKDPVSPSELFLYKLVPKK